MEAGPCDSDISGKDDGRKLKSFKFPTSHSRGVRQWQSEECRAGGKELKDDHHDSQQFSMESAFMSFSKIVIFFPKFALCCYFPELSKNR